MPKTATRQKFKKHKADHRRNFAKLMPCIDNWSLYKGNVDRPGVLVPKVELLQVDSSR
jgi:hypothetical protein